MLWKENTVVTNQQQYQCTTLESLDCYPIELTSFPIPYFRNVKFVRVFSLFDKYKKKCYIVNILILYFPEMTRTIVYVHFYLLLDFPIAYASISACLHQTVNIGVFLTKKS